MPILSGQFDQQLARTFGVSVAELAILAATNDKIAADNAAINSDEIKYQNRRAALEQFGDIAVLKGYQSQRDAAFQNRINDLQKSLTPAGWAGLQAFMNNVLRPSIHLVASPQLVQKVQK